MGNVCGLNPTRLAGALTPDRQPRIPGDPEDDGGYPETYERVRDRHPDRDSQGAGDDREADI
jgi:hypothetical protein